MNGRGKRQKGANGERELATLLSNELGFEVKRQLGQARDGGHDIQVGRFVIEVKRQERLAIESWCQQVELACTTVSKLDQDGDLGDPVPVVVYRRNGQPWRAVVPLGFLVKGIREDLSERGSVLQGKGRGQEDNAQGLLHELSGKQTGSGG